MIEAAAKSYLEATRFDSEFAWLSWAGTVWRLSAGPRVIYIKRAAALRAERDRLSWLAGRLPVPELLGFYQAAGDEWLITREVPGVPLYHLSVGWEPDRVAHRFGELLREIHSVDASTCPFGVRTPGNVLIHGCPTCWSKTAGSRALWTWGARGWAILVTTWPRAYGASTTTSAQATERGSWIRTAPPR
jgi:hypothetical protein